MAADGTADAAVATVIRTAQAALDARQRAPQEAVLLGRQALALARGRGRADPDGAAGRLADARSTAHRAIGLALRELNDFPAALRHLRAAVRIGDQGGSPRVAALARMSLGYVLSNTGRNSAALRAVTAALAELTGADAGHARLQRGAVLHFCGRYDEAVRDYDAAVTIARHESDLLLEARARNNRGLLHAHLGAARDSTDFDRAEEIFAGLDLHLAAADVRWNAGIAAARRGDVPGALRIFASAEARYRRLNVPRPALLLDRLDLLLSVPLLAEAAELAASAVRELRRRDMASDLAEALLAQARVALLAGDLDVAAQAAAAARDRFRRQRRPVWAAFARQVGLQAEMRQGVRSAAQLTAMIRTAGALDAAGWRAPALSLWLSAAQVAGDLGRTGQARALLGTARQARRGGTAVQRSQGWYAEALLRRVDGDDRGAAAALRRGLAVLDAHRATLGATELRAHTGTHGRELAEEGLALAVRAGSAAAVLEWAELGRAGALRVAPVLPPPDPELARAVEELRVVSADLERAVLDGQQAPSLRGRQLKLELHIRELTRRVDGAARPAHAPGGAPPAVHLLGARLGPAVLVEYLVHLGQLLAVVVRDGQASLHRLGELDGVLRQARLLRFTLRRLVTMPARSAPPALALAPQAPAVFGGGGPVSAGVAPLPARASARLSAVRAAGQLDARLLAPLAGLIGDRPLVVVPIGALHAVPWSTLPTCAGRPVTVAPSAAVWQRAAAGAGQPTANGAGPVVLAAGPRLPAAVAEVGALAAVMPRARVLVGAQATGAAVGAALDGAGLAHIAAHGTFRADSPLFSTIELADGPLIGYELERLARPPGCVVLSACDAGLSTVHPGDELMGFTAALLGLGTRTLIAAVLPVPAEATTALMLDLHARMRAGDGPAAALAGAARRAGDAGDEGYAAAAGFVCFGAG